MPFQMEPFGVGRPPGGKKRQGVEALPAAPEIGALTREALARGDEVYVLVSNKAEGCGPRTIELLARALAPAR